MEGLFGLLQVMFWALAGLAVIMTGGIALVIVILAFIGRFVWLLVFSKDRK